jgi:hypothetical protein
MGIVYCSNGRKDQTRQKVLDYIKQKKQQNPNFKVIDIGGALGNWAEEYTDAYIDLARPKTQKPVFHGDLNKPEVWEEVLSKHGQFDFSICTHVLEDIRNPVFVAEQIQKISKAGFISFPNKHTEFSNIESHYWTGNAHHRWVFTIKDEQKSPYLFFMPKWCVSNYYNREHQSPHVFLKRVLRLTNKDKNFGTSRKIDWLKSDIANLKHELGFIWEGSFKFDYLDYGYNPGEMLRSYQSLLSEGL